MTYLRRHAFQNWALLLGVIAVTGLLIAAGDPVSAADPAVTTAAAPAAPSSSGPVGVDDNKFVGAGKCKNCHKAEAGGDQYSHWEKSKHAKAFEALAGDAAKKAGAERGIDDPQKADACLKCHTTAFGLGEDAVDKKFDATLGVQCEACHGPGDKHVKARFAAAMKAKGGEVEPPAEGEIVTRPDATVCTGCHNEESPTFEGFCFKSYSKMIRHLDPRRELSEERKKELEGPCEHGEECPHDPAKKG